MKNVLFVDCCIRREASNTKKLAEAFLAALPSALPVRAPVRAGRSDRDRRAVLGSVLPGAFEGLY